MRGRTGQFAPWSGELTLALDRAEPSRPRRRAKGPEADKSFRCSLFQKAATLKPAQPGRKSRSLVIPARRAVNKGPAGSAPVKSPAQLCGCPFRTLAPKGGARFRGQGRLACGGPRGIFDAIKKPPTRVSYGKQSSGLFFYFPAFAEGN